MRWRRRMRKRSMRLSRRRRGKNMKYKSKEMKTRVSEWGQINAAPHEQRAVFDALSLVPVGVLPRPSVMMREAPNALTRIQYSCSPYSRRGSRDLSS